MNCFKAEIIRYIDYYPFGFEMAGRADQSVNYRYGFNGMEKDKEFTNSTSHYDFGARIYDSRLGRWLAVDPVIQSGLSPYNSFANNPIIFIDPNGETQVISKDGEVIWDDGKNDGNVYMAKSKKPKIDNNSTLENIQKSRRLAQITEGVTDSDGKFAGVRIVASKRRMKKYIKSQLKIMGVYGYFKGENVSIDISNNINTDIQLPNKPYHSGKHVYLMTNPEDYKLKIEVGLNAKPRDNYYYGNIYDFRNVIDHEITHQIQGDQYYKALEILKGEDKYRKDSDENMHQKYQINLAKNEIEAYETMRKDNENYDKSSDLHKENINRQLERYTKELKELEKNE